MAERWIADASVLICLAKAGHLPLLSELSPALIIPTAVLEEILAGPPGDPARLALSQGWGTRLPLTTALPQVLEWGLGAGESAVLSACLTEPSSSVALIDDGEARACARALGLKVKGTLGVIILAAKRGLILKAGPVVNDLIASGLRLDTRLVQTVLRQALDEAWDA